MPKLSQFFCVAVAGATCDGRVIDEAWINEMAETYNPATYGARVNIEHLRGMSAEAPFHAYGDVRALEARTIDIPIGGKTEKRRALFAQIEALDNLLSINAKGQKLYTSIEVNPDFAGTGKAYLQGLAVTDSPASLGTDVLAFAATQGDKNPFAARKHAPGNFISAASEATLAFDAAPSAQSESSGLIAIATTFFAGLMGSTPTPPAPPNPPEPANDNDAVTALTTKIGEGFTKITAAMSAMSTETTTALGKLRTDHDALKASVESTDSGGPKRPPATGAGSFSATDC